MIVRSDSESAFEPVWYLFFEQRMKKSSFMVQEEKEAACDTRLVYAEKKGRSSVQRPQRTSITSDPPSKFSAENVILRIDESEISCRITTYVVLKQSHSFPLLLQT